MQPNTHRHHSAPQGRVAAWGWLALKWMMVLLMLIDQVGSPLHRHHHDSGVDAAFASGSHHHEASGEVTHFDEGVDHDAFAHATLAVRQANAAQLSVAPYAADDGQFTWVLVTSVLAFLALATLRGESLIRPYARWRAPSKPSHRSLPPAGRAPPLHA